MKVLVCSLDYERKKLIGFDLNEVIGATTSDFYKAPLEIEGVLGAVVYDNKTYTAVGFQGVVGGEKIRVFVVLKNGYAVGVLGLEGVVNLEETNEVQGLLSSYFKRSFRWNGTEVFLVDTTSFEDLAHVPENIKIDVEGIEKEEERREKLEEFVIVEITGERYAISKSDIVEIVEPAKMNKFLHGNIIGFISSGKDVVPILWNKRPKKINWIIVLESVAVPVESFEVIEGRYVKSEKQLFVEFGDEKLPIINEKHLKEVI